MCFMVRTLNEAMMMKPTLGVFLILHKKFISVLTSISTLLTTPPLSATYTAVAPGASNGSEHIAETFAGRRIGRPNSFLDFAARRAVRDCDALVFKVTCQQAFSCCRHIPVWGLQMWSQLLLLCHWRKCPANAGASRHGACTTKCRIRFFLWFILPRLEVVSAIAISRHSFSTS